MIIDFHTHIFPDKIASEAINALSKSGGIEPHASGMLSGLLSSMEKNGIDISVNLPVVTKPSQFDSITRFSREINENTDTGRKIISFAGIHPDTPGYESALYEIKALGFKGIKIHPDYQGVFIDDMRYIKILALAKELDLITVTHAGVDAAFIGQEIKCTPIRVLRLLDALGGYDKLVLAHLGANELYDDVYNSLAGQSVYFDTAYVLPFLTRAMVEKMILRHGEGKILFATDSPWQDQGNMVSLLKSYELGSDVEDKILYKNAKGLLKL